tara:strand:+ start:294 stop:446 length:153 start_codon:yes stop_codon:yes gene_type:complete
MAKYSFRVKGSDEDITTVNARSKEEAISFFSKGKNLTEDKFVQLYEVIKK